MPNIKKEDSEKQIKRINISLTQDLYDDVEILSYLYGISTLSGTVTAILKKHLDEVRKSEYAAKFDNLRVIVDIRRQYGPETFKIVRKGSADDPTKDDPNSNEII